MVLGVRCGGVVLVLVRRSRRVVEEECVVLSKKFLQGFGEGGVIG